MAEYLKLRTRCKIKTYEEVNELLENDRKQNLRIVQCHGVFDLLHPGHIRHFKSAKSQGDRLVVTITSDRFVNKGPGRPAFNENLRLESIAALEDVDYVVLNDSPDAVSAIRKICPSIYVKGFEYADHQADVTGKIRQEVLEVEKNGGTVFYTNDIVFSSSSLLNRYLEPLSPDAEKFIALLKKQFSIEGIVEKIEALKGLKILVIGDAIIDEYQYVEPLGQSGKGLHMVARNLDKEVFLGGSLIIANHLAQFADQVTLVTAVGNECPYASFINTNLDARVTKKFVYLDEISTLVKKRYVLKDGKTLSKLFETYSGQENGPNNQQSQVIINFLKNHGKEFDLILSSDFGNGFMNSALIHAVTEVPAFLAVNTQTNSGNRGFNTITNYQRANYISLNEPELRLAAHDKTSSLDGIVVDISDILNCQSMSVTQGVNGVICFSRNEAPTSIPAFASQSVDRVGAGDAFLALSSICLASGMPMILSGFIGSLAAAMNVQTIGNQESIKKSALMKYIIRMLK